MLPEGAAKIFDVHDAVEVSEEAPGVTARAETPVKCRKRGQGDALTTWCGLPPDQRPGTWASRWGDVTCMDCIAARQAPEPRQEPKEAADPFGHITDTHASIGAMLAPPAVGLADVLAARFGRRVVESDGLTEAAGRFMAALVAALDEAGYLQQVSGPWVAVGLTGLGMMGAVRESLAEDGDADNGTSRDDRRDHGDSGAQGGREDEPGETVG